MSDDKQKSLQLFLAGATYKQIAATVGITEADVDGFVREELAATAGRREILLEEARAIHQERSEALFRAHWGSALRGDHRSAEICRRILDRQSRAMYGDNPAIEGDAVDEIAARRAARRASSTKSPSRTKRA